MNADAAPLGTGGALDLQGTLRADLFGKVDDATKHKRHLLRSRAPDELLFPVQALPGDTDSPILAETLRRTVHVGADVKTQTIWLSGSSSHPLFLLRKVN